MFIIRHRLWQTTHRHLNTFVMNGLAQLYYYGEFIFSLGAPGVMLNLSFFFFFYEIPASKQTNPRWDCSTTSRAILFAL